MNRRSPLDEPTRKTPEDPPVVTRQVTMMASQTDRPAGAQPELSAEVADALQRGRAHAERGRYRSAIETWRTVYERRAADQSLTDAERRTLQRQIAAAFYARSQLSVGRRAGPKSWRQALQRLGEALNWDPDCALYAFEAGRCHWHLGQREQALALFAQALAGRGATSEMRYYTALAQFHAGSPQDALRTLSTGPATEESPAFLRAWRRLQAHAMAAAGDPVGAVARLSAWAESDPTAQWIGDTLVLARSTQPTPELCRAVAALYTAVRPLGQRSSDAAALAELLGDMHIQLGDEEGALQWWTESLELRASDACAGKICALCERKALAALASSDFDTGLGWCATGLKVRPSQSVLRRLQRQLKLRQAQSLWEAARVDEAIALWNELTARDQLVDAAWNVALAWEAAGEPRQAADAWRRVAALAQKEEPGVTERQASLRAAAHRITLEEYAEARVDLERAAAGAGADPRAMRLLALTALLDGEPKQAAELLERAVAAAPSDPELLVSLAAAYDETDAPTAKKIERWRAAMAAIDEPWVREAWRRRTLDLGMQAWQENDLDRAMDIFAGLLFDNRHEPDGWIWCGTIHLQRGSAERAAVCFEHALAADPSTETLIKIGGCYLMSGLEKEAEAYFAQAASSAPGPATELRIAEVCREVGNNEFAFDHLTSAVERTAQHGPHLYRIVQLLVDVREGHDLEPLFAKIARIIDKPYRIKFLIGAEKIWRSEWSQVQKIFAEVRKEAEADGDHPLLEDLRYVEKAMILVLTTGSVDYEEFAERIKRAAHRYAQGVSSEAEQESPLAIVRKTTARRLAESAREILAETLALREAASQTPEPELPWAPLDFGKKPDWNRLIPAQIEPVKAPAFTR